MKEVTMFPPHKKLHLCAETRHPKVKHLVFNNILVSQLLPKVTIMDLCLFLILLRNSSVLVISVPKQNNYIRRGTYFYGSTHFPYFIRKDKFISSSCVYVHMQVHC
jgi:hypothetical protein